MKKLTDELRAFEQQLFSFMNEAQPRTPLTAAEVAAIFKNYGPPEDIEAEEKEHLVNLMKAAHEKKARKIHPVDSLEGLFQLICDSKRLPAYRLAELLNLAEDEVEAYRRESLSPERLGRERLLHLAALAGITIRQMVAVIDKTITRRIRKSPTSSATTGQSYQEWSGSEPLKVSDGSPLYGKLQQSAAEQTKSWEALREALLQEAARVSE